MGKAPQKAVLKPVDIDLTGDDTDDDHEVLLFICIHTQSTHYGSVSQETLQDIIFMTCFAGAMRNASKLAGSSQLDQLWPEMQRKAAATTEPQGQAAPQLHHRYYYRSSSL